jgi:glyoxylase-like metal-dependent hydrolase (beta-lactamase superfamily II)
VSLVCTATLISVTMRLDHRPSILLALLGGLTTPLHAQGTAGAPAPQRAPAIERVQLADGIYLFRAPSAMDKWTATNSVAIINDTDVTVFDSHTRPSTTRRVLEEIRKLTPRPVRVLINSHWHMDHWMGNEVYASAFPGLQIVATAETADYMRRIPNRFFVNSIGADRRAAQLDTMVRTGRRPDGSVFTAEARAAEERSLEEIREFAAEISNARQQFPTLTFRDSLTLWSGGREFRLYSVVGDATGSTVLYLPRERLLVTGDVLVRHEDGTGAQPWTTNSYLITPWLTSLRRLAALDAAIIVPGQGPALHDRQFLELTIGLFASLIRQVHSAMERGAVTVAEVQREVDLSALRLELTKGDPVRGASFDRVVTTLIRKVMQEARDGIVPG